jgi:hypothetical protein
MTHNNDRYHQIDDDANSNQIEKKVLRLESS